MKKQDDEQSAQAASVTRNWCGACESSYPMNYTHQCSPASNDYQASPSGSASTEAKGTPEPTRAQSGSGDGLGSGVASQSQTDSRVAWDWVYEGNRVCMALWEAGFSGTQSAENGPIMMAAKQVCVEAYLAGAASKSRPEVKGG